VRKTLTLNLQQIRNTACFALFEKGGGYLVWLWLRENKSIFVGLMGTITLAIYGIIPTL
jgi:small multidrug resistance family-3 protein